MTRSIERDVDIANQRVATPPMSGNTFGPKGAHRSGYVGNPWGVWWTVGG